MTGTQTRLVACGVAVVLFVALGGVAAAGSLAPSVAIDYSPESPAAGEQVTFEANATVEEGSIAGYEWRIDGEVVSERRTFGYTFEDPGEHEVEVLVTDTTGSTASRVVTVSVAEANRPPTVFIADSPETPAPGDRFVFRGNARDVDGIVESYEWRINGEVVSENRAFGYAFDAPGEYEVTFVATDDDNATATATKTITVVEGTPTPTPSSDGGGSSFPLPGFGAVVALGAIAVALLARSRR